MGTKTLYSLIEIKTRNKSVEEIGTIMTKEIVIDKNYLNWDETRKVKVENIISEYLIKIDELINSDQTDYALYEEAILVIAELYDAFIDQEKWLENSYIVLNKLKDRILSGYYIGKIGYIDGICNIGFAVTLLHKKSGYFGKFKESLNKYIFQLLEKVIDQYKEIDETFKANNYDLIYGLSGSGIYLLECDKSYKRDCLVKEIVNYLDRVISGTHLYDSTPVPNWHILGKNHFLNSDKEYYKNGSFDFSLSHGVAGIYVMLSYAYLEGIQTLIAKKNMKIIENLYKKYTVDMDGVYYTPGRIRLEEFLSNQMEFNNYRQSWCYGTIGVYGAFMQVANKLHNNEMEEYVYNNIVNIASQEIEAYELVSPIICHGFSGILEILLSTYKIKKNPIIFNRITEMMDLLIKSYDKKSIYGFKNISVIYENGIWKKEEIDSNNFLEGASGIILVLFSLFEEKTFFSKLLLN